MRRCLTGLAAACLPQLAMAHSPMRGIGEFYAGMLHPVLVPPHALALFLFALLVGQGGVRAMRFAYPPFLLALATGLMVAAFICGLLVALQASLAMWLYAVLAAAMGLIIGSDSGVTDYTRQETFAALLGTWLGATISLVLVAGVVELLARPWLRVAVRVLGSWGTASAVLVLAMALR